MQEKNGNHSHNVVHSKSCCNCLFAIFRSRCHQDDIVILVIGLDNAGKSTFISTIRKEEKNDETPIWGFDKKKWSTQNFQVSIYELGGGKSSRALWPNFYSKAHGAIFVVDGADESALWEASKELQNAMKHPRLARKPFLVVANKLNEGTALHYDKLMGALGPFDTNTEAFVYCDCRLQYGGTIIQKDLQLGLDWFLASIKLRFKELQEQVTFESNKQNDEEQRSLKERYQRSKSFQEEKEAASYSPVVVLPHLEDRKSDTYTRMLNWIGDDSNPIFCTFEERTNHGHSFKVSASKFDESLQPLIKQYDEKGSPDSTYTPSQIAEYFGHSKEQPDDTPHLPGQSKPLNVLWG